MDFSTTTDTFIALDSDDTSVGGIVEGQFLPDLSKRGGHESSTSSSLRGLADKVFFRLVQYCGSWLILGGEGGIVCLKYKSCLTDWLNGMFEIKGDVEIC